MTNIIEKHKCKVEQQKNVIINNITPSKVQINFAENAYQYI